MFGGKFALDDDDNYTVVENIAQLEEVIAILLFVMKLFGTYSTT